MPPPNVVCHRVMASVLTPLSRGHLEAQQCLGSVSRRLKFQTPRFRLGLKTECLGLGLGLGLQGLGLASVSTKKAWYAGGIMVLSCSSAHAFVHACQNIVNRISCRVFHAFSLNLYQRCITRQRECATVLGQKVKGVGHGGIEYAGNSTFWVFTRATLCQRGSLRQRSVCLSVRPSVRHTPVLCLAERKQDREMYTI